MMTEQYPSTSLMASKYLNHTHAAAATRFEWLIFIIETNIISFYTTTHQRLFRTITKMVFSRLKLNCKRRRSRRHRQYEWMNFPIELWQEVQLFLPLGHAIGGSLRGVEHRLHRELSIVKEIIVLMLDYRREDDRWRVYNKWMCAPPHIADIFDQLINSNVTIASRLTFKGDLAHACKIGLPSAIIQLSNRLNVEVQHNQTIATCLNHFLIRHMISRNYDAAEALLFCGADPSTYLLIRDGINIFASHLVLATAVNEDIVGMRLLLHYGADLRHCGGHAITHASRRGCLVIVKELLRHGVSPDALRGAPLVHAVLHGRIDVVNCLIQHGASISMDQALHAAIRRSNIHFVELLLNNRANPCAYGHQLFPLAIVRCERDEDSAEIIKLLMRSRLCRGECQIHSSRFYKNLAHYALSLSRTKTEKMILNFGRFCS